ncbi:MAG: hypothetical protein AABZ06_12510 [Bdellovibrionota bacterium]
MRHSKLSSDSYDFIVMGFIIEKVHDSTHVLNAVSPAFTASIAFADMVTKDIVAG